MAVTGYTRNGCCAHNTKDEGSHHVCVKNVRSTEDKPSFCEVTEQTNWCDRKHECADHAGECPIEKWCVCEWAFEKFVKKKDAMLLIWIQMQQIPWY
jgi:uncharacterized protein (DUF2237 family)